jgi:hypothetical protein
MKLSVSVITEEAISPPQLHLGPYYFCGNTPTYILEKYSNFVLAFLTIIQSYIVTIAPDLELI